MAAPSAAATSPTDQERLANKIRFETELEFVQCLANPYYLQSLAQQGLFADEAFLNYLNYLLYFTSPRFARFLQYPQALHHLHLLTDKVAGPAFRTALKEQPLLAQDLAGKQLAHWAGWRETGEGTVWKEPVVGEEQAGEEEQAKVA
ncbi:SOH1-domain-containing protein [Leucosporidium creatinivorum]|uniref:Mediator of RNA polymerase II transcription subunit 31 n=1 Tax=Leucosporidium creatinivorum TaxID=106004 RepID=A0A1Y2D0V9_9BASI|nr:SOH1-domain-containing protein [Leucosporidium creatinivorum]